MGNLAFTNSELEPGDEVSVKSYSRARNAPPLELIPKKIPVGHAVPDLSSWKGLNVDPLAVKRDPMSSFLSFVLHVGILALVLWFGFQAHKQIVAPRRVQVIPLEIQPYIPITVPVPPSMGGGGGGGARQVVEASKGHLPPVAKTQIVPVETLQVDHPRLAATPTVMMPQPVKIPDNKMPNFGDTQSPQVALVSQGSGSGSGFGQGRGGGIGAGRGAGVGPGSVGGYGGGVMRVGSGVTAPQIIHSVEPDFSDAARQAKYQGAVSIQLIVDAQGNPQDIQVLHRLGMGLDEKAVEAVRQYKFRPAMYQGHPVPVQMVIDVDFHLD